ncbi:LamB/YcsF family protein [Brachybacterium endophyticum]|uniref:5-oxoprolinase subunit A n=1 Tax=Brachybacterium endophyticum TaxID=2182385 RepID=A0A2U2RJT5_9MICO|nr:5-oxoprolinase subunit PxpA [Brachybacterium endophyticum]PWH06120.1 LamB/YcsF family protein [Brachybacterium endophyticum]
MSSIDLNSDIGESFGAWRMGDDEAILDVVTSANIACGFHAGDPSQMRATARGAAARDVTIGAHVAYRDLAGFGRRFVDASTAELTDDLIYQIGALRGIAAAEGARVTYVKPHGALYNTIVEHGGHARAVVDAVRALQGGGEDLALLLLPGSRAGELAREAGIEVVGEAFADRAYTPEGTLVSRREPGAVIEDPQLVADRMVRFAEEGVLEAVDGTRLRIDARSICLHGDTPGAVDLARAVRRALEDAGVTIGAFA